MDSLARGAVCLVLETESEARRRGSTPYARFSGWGQASDGHNVAISHPEGRGLRDSMNKALMDARAEASSIEYVNAHAPSTPIGDASEIKALKQVFPAPQGVAVSSTKALTGHGLSLFQHHGGFLLLFGFERRIHTRSANISQPDPELEHLQLIRQTETRQVDRILSNSSGFGGANVSLIFDRVAL